MFGFLLVLQCTVCWCIIRRLWKCKYDVYVGDICACYVYMCGRISGSKEKMLKGETSLFT